MSTAEFMRIVIASHELERWLGRNVGSNADWPAEIRTDNQESADALCGLINELKSALEAFRKEYDKNIK